MKEIKWSLNKLTYRFRNYLTAFVILTTAVTSSHSQNFSGLEKKSLTKIDDIGAGIVSLIGSGGLEGKIGKVVVTSDTERTLKMALTYTGFSTAYLHVNVLAADKVSQDEVGEAEVDLTDKTSPLYLEMNLKDNVAEGFELESAYLQLRISKSKTAVGGLVFLYSLNKSWQKEIKAENLVLRATLVPVGVTSQLKESSKVLIIPDFKPVMMYQVKEPVTRTTKTSPSSSALRNAAVTGTKNDISRSSNNQPPPPTANKSTTTTTRMTSVPRTMTKVSDNKQPPPPTAKSTTTATRMTSVPRAMTSVSDSKSTPGTVASSMDGTWKNSDPNTRGITKVIISGNGTRIQTFGSCSPTDCDWGKVPLTRSGANFRATYDESMAVTYITFGVSGNEMKLTSDRRYKDKRAPLVTTAKLIKETTTSGGQAVILNTRLMSVNPNLVRAGLALDKSETDNGAQGPDNNPIPLFEDLTVTRDFEFPYEITNISMDVFPDRNPKSGIFYYMPSAYHLRWTPDEGYAFRVLYGTATAESSGDVRMSATLSPDISKKEIDLISKLVASYASRNQGMEFDKLRLIPIRENPVVSFPADLNNLYEITADKVSVNITSSLREPFQISWVTDNNTKDEMQVSLLEKTGIQGIMSLQPQSENIPEIKIPVIITLADSRTIGRIDLESKKWRTNAWKNQTPYPLKLKYLHMLLVKEEGNKSTPFIYSWSINDLVVPVSASVSFDASNVPSWLDDPDMAQRIWVEYAVVDCDDCDRDIINTITGGTFGTNTRKVTFETFQIFENIDAQFIQIIVRSRQGDPKGEKTIEFEPLRIYQDNELAESGQLYVPLEEALSYEYFITVVMKNGNSYKADQWIGASEPEIYLGLDAIRTAIPGIPVEDEQ
ncbi:MAG: hypothetical protein IH592_01745 [Bacteroidales bacterium]|nr:hypothetical protein [Bacteroidales bacterium]